LQRHPSFFPAVQLARVCGQIYAQHKVSKVAANEVDDKLQREISVVAARRIKAPPQLTPRAGVTRKLVETLHSAWNKIFSGNDATAIDRHDGFASARSISCDKIA
jgi:hypothetical protein